MSILESKMLENCLDTSDVFNSSTFMQTNHLSEEVNQKRREQQLLMEARIRNIKKVYQGKYQQIHQEYLLKMDQLKQQLQSEIKHEMYTFELKMENYLSNLEQSSPCKINNQQTRHLSANKQSSYSYQKNQCKTPKQQKENSQFLVSNERSREKDEELNDYPFYPNKKLMSQTMKYATGIFNKYAEKPLITNYSQSSEQHSNNKTEYKSKQYQTEMNFQSFSLEKARSQSVNPQKIVSAQKQNRNELLCSVQQDQQYPFGRNDYQNKASQGMSTQYWNENVNPKDIRKNSQNQLHKNRQTYYQEEEGLENTRKQFQNLVKEKHKITFSSDSFSDDDFHLDTRRLKQFKLDSSTQINLPQYQRSTKAIDVRK